MTGADGEKSVEGRDLKVAATVGEAGKLFIAMPIYGAMPAEAVSALVGLVDKRPQRMQIRTRLHDSLVTRARNSLTADFLESGCEKLLFIDADLIYTPEHVARIAGHDADVVGGFYPIKEDEPRIRWCVNGPEGTTEPNPDEHGLTELRYVGSGFCCIRRKVFERLMDSGLVGRYLTDGTQRRQEWDFWSVGVYESKTPGVAGRYLSEDWMFCQRWLDLGGKIYGDVNVQLRHVGSATWPLKHQS